MKQQQMKNDSLEQLKQEEENRLQQKKEEQKASAEVDKRVDLPNRPSI